MKLVLILMLSLGLFLNAEIPENYYILANGLSGEELKATLHDIIDGHTTYPYTADGTDTWDILKVADRDPDNSANVILIYTAWSVDAAQEYNGGDGWSREHVWAKSHGGFDEDTIPGRDVHNLKPVYQPVNASRGNKDFDMGGTPNQYATECYTDADSWEPRDEVKGDVARMIFYMVTRYEGDGTEPDLEMVDYIPSSPSYEPFHAKKSVLLEWHASDPVDAFEQNRNDVIYSYQDNRNPFIDHPEYASYIWEGGEPEPEPGSLFISEYSDATGTGNFVYEFIEIYNENSNAIDISGYVIRQQNSTQSFSIPSSTTIPANGFLVVGRNSAQSAFESFWEITLLSSVIYLNSGNLIPQINGDEVFLFENASGVNVDPATDDEYSAKAITEGNRVYRQSSGNTLADWALNDESNATPGVLDEDQTLPITLTSFTASYSKNAAVLNWITQSETDNLGFNLYRSESENGFENSLALNSTLIPGMGTTSTPTNYSFVDEYPLIEGHTYYYWLQSVSTSQEFELFGPVNLAIPIQGEIPGANAQTNLQAAYPNPFNPHTTISFNIAEGETGIFTIYNIKGQTVMREEYETGVYKLEWNAAGLTSGLYLYKLSSPTLNLTRKMVLLK